MDIANYTAIIAAFISALGVIAMSQQIRSDIKLNRSNQTFKKIEELDELLYHRSELKDIISNIRVINDCEDPLSIAEAEEIYNNNKLRIFEILNFFESLSLEVFCKNIDKKILYKIYGPRLCNAYEKLHPFILVIADIYKKPNIRPYQHFDLLYKKFDKKRGGKKWTLKK